MLKTIYVINNILLKKKLYFCQMYVKNVPICKTKSAGLFPAGSMLIF
jgi:hypothetical protein